MKASRLQKKSPGTILFRSAVIFITVLILLLATAYSVMWILVNGPSPTARRLFVLSVKETSAAGFLADMYLSDAEIEEILGGSGNSIEEEEMDLSLISLPNRMEEETQKTETSASDAPDSSKKPVQNVPAAAETESAVQETIQTAAQDDGIEVIDVEGSTYNGKLMIISDPSRVFVGVPDSYGENSSGLTVASMIEKYDCIAGTNAGGFYDPNGSGTGGIPEGIVI